MCADHRETSVDFRPSNDTPYDRASFMSRLFFSWVTPIFVRSFRRRLSETEIFEISRGDSTAVMSELFDQSWRVELETRESPSLMRSMIRLFWRRYFLLGILLFVESLLSLFQPIIIWKLLSHSKTIHENLTESFIYASALIVTIFIIILLRNPYYFYTLKMGLQLKVGMSGLIYQKILRLNQKALGQTTTGQIINLLSSDVQKFELGIPHLHYLWISPIITIGAIAILYYFTHECGLAAILIFFILVPVQIGLGKLIFKLRIRIARITDERLKMVSDLINGIQVIKMYCWESMFIQVIGDLRRKILLYGFQRKLVRTLWVTLRFIGGRFIMIAFLASFFVFEVPLSSQTVWITVILVNQIRGSIVDRLSLCINHCIDMKVSVKRLQTFLSLSEYENMTYPRSIGEHQSQIGDRSSTMRPSVTFENVSAHWNENYSNRLTLNNISFCIKAPQTCAIIGEVGSGKSSIFMALLGELPLNNGNIIYEGSLSYASQQPWIFSGTVRQNVLFNRLLVDKDYHNILNVTALEQDIKGMELRDLTVVGERGVLLSGGQKARISLARATLSNADIVLLDDPLAAVDAAVGCQIFSDCISGLLKDKLVLLVTHHLYLLKLVDKIVVLHEGNLVAFGTFDEITAQGIDLQNILKKESTDKFVENLGKSINEDTSNISSMTEEDNYNYNNKRANTEDSTPLLNSNTRSSQKDKKEDNLEQYSSGNIKFSFFWKYLAAGSSSFWVIVMFVVYVWTMSLYVFCDIWLSWWTKEMDNRNITSKNFYQNDSRYLFGFIILCLATFVFGLIAVTVLFVICLYTSKILHEKLLQAVLLSPMKFFNENSAGRILNRFSKDISIMDDLLPVTAQDCILTVFLVISTLVVATYKNFWCLIVIVPLLIIFWALRKSYINVSNTIKRIEAVTRSPLFGHISTTLQGLATIRAFNCQNWFVKDFQNKQDRHSKSFFLYMCTSRWLAFRLDEVCFIFIIFVTYICIALLYYEKINSSDFGLVLTYIIGLIGLTQWAIRQSTEVENQMVSVERIYDYIDLPAEKPVISKKSTTLSSDWPRTGKIEFSNVSLVYKMRGPYVLRNVNFIIEDKEKIGIVGRTGAGKSSLISLLFRLVEIPEDCGRILIDEEDISCIELRQLRESMAVIPQDPVLFMGTIRMNLDPFKEFSDNELWSVLETVELSETIKQLPNKLLSSVSEGGGNLSVGQRQLICMARALLKNVRIIVIDEATANIDLNTENLIQKTLKTKFVNCTMLTIAHRLNTIMDSDKIIVMSNGKVEEFDHPHVLFTDHPTALFSQLVRQTGPAEEGKLKKIAETNFLNRKKKI